MPFLLAPLLPVALRLGVVATVTYSVTRWVAARSHPGRTDQRAEDALDDLGEGLTLHKPADRAEDRQTNTSARMRRVIRFGGKTWEVDATMIARLRLRSRDE